MRVTRRNQHKRGNRIRNVIAALFFIVGVGLLLLEPLKNYLIQRGQEINAVNQLTREQISANEQREVTYNFEDVKTLNPYNVISQNVNPKDLPVVGAIAIPQVKMQLPIYKGVSDAGMYLGAGTLTPEQKMGESNYSIASHHSIHKGMLFQPLMDVKIGDTVYLTDLDKIYTYEINYKEQVDPYRLDLIEPTDEAIVTMITCDATLEYRVVVQAKLVKTTPIAKATKDMIQAFELKQTVPES